MLNKCQGIWIYLHYVVHEIEGQKDSQFNLEDLPEGMTQYYARYWKRWRDADAEQWDRAYLPLLSTLAAAQVALTVECLAEWANVTMPEALLRRLLNERWRPFLTVIGQGVQTRYRFYHASLQEFFDGRVRREKLAVAEEAFVEELAFATRSAHHRLTERYLTAWGSLQAGLPKLAETTQRELDDGYGLRYIAAHLEGAGRAKDLHCLLALETNEQRNVWYKAKHANGDVAEYLADVTRAWRLANDNAAVPNGHGVQAALLCQYALITASLRSLAKVVPDHLLVAAVEQGRWSIERAMAHAHLPAEPGERAAAMIALIPLVKQRASWLDDTLEALAQTDVGDREDLVARLAAVTAEAELLMILRHITSWVRGARSPFEENRTTQLVHHVLERLPASFATEALHIIDGTSVRPLRLYALLPEPQRAQRIREALKKTHELDGELGVALYASSVASLAKHLGRDAVEGLLDEALAEVRELASGSVLRIQALIRLLPYLASGEQHVVFEELIGSALDKEPRLFAMLAKCAPPFLHAQLRQSLETQKLAWIAEAAPHFTGEHREALIERVLSEIERQENAASLLWMDQAELITAMNEHQLERARMVINSRLDGSSKVTALTAVARTTSPKNRDCAVADLLAAIEDLGDIDERAIAFHALAPLLAGRYLDEALAAAERIGEPSGREHLAKMLPYLSDPASAPSGTDNTVCERIDPDLPLDHVRSHLAHLIFPEEPLDSIRLINAMVHGLPSLSVKDELRPSMAAALALRMAALGDTKTAFELLLLGRNDAVTVMALVELSTHLPKEEVLVVEKRVPSVSLDTLWIPERPGRVGLPRDSAQAYLGARLAPSLARVGEIERAQMYVRKVEERWQPAAWLGIAAATSGSVRTSALLEALASVLDLRDVFRRDHLDSVAHAIAKESAIAEPAWRTAVEWARAHPRHEAIGVLATFAPVAAALGGAALVREVYSTIERVLRWWP